MSSDLNPYPQTWEEFDELRKYRGYMGSKLPRPDHRNSLLHTRYVIPNIKKDIYYAVTTRTAHCDQFCLFGEIEKNIFLAEQKEKTRCEINCYKHASALGFATPDKYSCATSFCVTESGMQYAQVIAIGAVQAVTLENIFTNKSIDVFKKKYILQEAFFQAMTCGIVYADFDRLRMTNIIIKDFEEERPSNFVHIDFEYAGQSDSKSSLIAMLRSNEYYDMLNSVSNCQRLINCLDLTAEKVEQAIVIEQPDKETYLARIKAMRPYLM